MGGKISLNISCSVSAGAPRVFSRSFHTSHYHVVECRSPHIRHPALIIGGAPRMECLRTFPLPSHHPWPFPNPQSPLGH